MSATITTGAEEVAWDLSDLYSGPDDPRLETDMAAVRESVRGFKDRFRGRIAQLGPDELAAALRELDDIEGAHVRLGSYTYLLFSTDTADPVRGALLQRAQEWSAGLEIDLTFLRLEWAAVPDERADELLAAPELADWEHFLRAVRRFRPHLLSEAEETILTEKSVSGEAAWGRLFNELTSSLSAPIGGEDVSFEEALARLYSPERETRRAAAEGITEGLRPGLRTRSFIFNTLLLDKATDDRLRKYPHWLAARNLSNEAPDESVQALVDAVVSRYDLPQRYYRLKARLLGLDRLSYYDRMAPVSTDASTVSWDEARELVVEAYGEFTDETGRIVSDFFERRWIDAPVRPNKRNGAYCMTRVPGVHPYVLMNFTGDRRSVLTLAHELGHGLHGVLAQERGALNAATPLTLAETASVFGEALTFDRLVAADDDPSRRLDLLIGRLDDAIATVFRQIAMNRFEHTVHTARREEGELAPDRFAQAWIETQTEMLGDAVDLDGGYDIWWSYVPHYVVSPGYVYAYTFGYLFSLAIFRAWQREGDALVEPYLNVLRAGGSKSPEELAELVGLDLRSDRIWKDGLEALDDVMRQAEELAQTLA